MIRFSKRKEAHKPPDKLSLKRGLLLLALLAQPLLAQRGAAFAGEDMLLGNPWHHEKITEDAATAVGFTQDAADELGWNADYVDSYLYNPLWWAQGGLDRYKASVATHDELVKVHFDDLFDANKVRTMWSRYLTGTIAGLVWAKEKDDVAAARNIVGVSLHAIQDFYSHSSWVNNLNRRQRTWFDVPLSERNLMSFYTAAYEESQNLGIDHHGKYTPACSLMNQPGVKGILDVACVAISPLSNTTICQQYDECQKGTAVSGGSVLGVSIPDNVIYVAPPGIALDNTWLSAIGSKQRDLRDAAGHPVSGLDAFAMARHLAHCSSIQWLRTINTIMNKPSIGGGAFWNRVKTEGQTGAKEQQFEVYNKLPYTFVSAGTYPPTTSGEEYFLRVRLKTSNDSNSGTDADIFLKGAGKEYLLDYAPSANPILAYNDFERNDNDSYTVGPFPSMPGSITLENRAADGLDVLAALGGDFVAGLESLGESIKDFFLSIIGGHADFIAQNKKVWSAGELAGIGYSWHNFSIDVNGGDEGDYRIDARIRRTAEGSGTTTADDWAEYSVELTNLHCDSESDWDRGSDSDEPFVLSLLVPLPGAIQRYRTEPFDDVDSGEGNGIGHTFTTVRIPKSHGMLSLPVSVLESDDESGGDRDELLNTFAGEANEETDEERQTFIEALGASIAADWKLEAMEIFAFAKGGNVKAGTVYNGTPNRWIKGKENATFTLNTSNVTNYGVTSNEVQTADPCCPVANTGGPHTALEGGVVNFDASGSTYVENVPLTYAWDLNNDGTYETPGVTASLSLANVNGPATRTVGLKVCDPRFDLCGTATETLNVQNVAPVMSALENQSTAEGTLLTVALGSFTDPGADQPWTAKVDWGDGSSVESVTLNSVGSLDSRSHVYADNGAYVVKVSVTDKDGGSDTETFTVNVSNVNPTATFRDNGPVAEGSPATASFTDPSDPSTQDTAEGFKYAFDFGNDGSFDVTDSGNASANVPSHYLTDGPSSLDIRGRIQDKDGGYTDYTTKLTVSNVAPAVTPPSDQTITEGSPFAAQVGSFADPGADQPWKVTVDWGDGQTTGPFELNAPGPIPSLSHTFADNGRYTVKVTVTDKDNESDTEEFKIVVTNVAPTLSGIALVTPIDENGQTTLTGTLSDPGVLDTFALQVVWADGSSETVNYPASATGAQAIQLTHTYRDDNPTATPSDPYVVSLVVTDKDGDGGNGGGGLTVNNVAPVITEAETTAIPRIGVAGPPLVLTNVPLVAGSLFADPGTLDTHTATIDWGDGAAPQDLGAVSGETGASYVYKTPGVRTLTFRVSDDDTGQASTSRVVEVVTPLGALQKAQDDLLALLNRPNLSQKAKALIQSTLADLVGNNGGKASNGAIDKLQKGELNAALVKIEAALKDVAKWSAIDATLQLDRLQSLLGLWAKSVAEEAILKAQATATQPLHFSRIEQARAQVKQGDSLLENGLFLPAVQRYRSAIQKL